MSIDRFALWAIPSIVFIAALWLSRPERPARILMLVQSMAVIAMVAILCNGYEGFLLVLVAAQLAWRGRGRDRVSLLWIVVQTAAIGAAIAFEWTPRSALLLTPPYFGFQLLMYALVRSLAHERAARANLEIANRELADLQIKMVQTGRVDERLRMTQELHDVFGHRLTALSLNLEAALHENTVAARSTIERAQSLVRALLSDAKGLVTSLQDESLVDLPRELRELARDLPSPTIHLDCAESLQVAHPITARALLRCAQEIVTNAIRHGSARNVWLRLSEESGRICLIAVDDGTGANEIQDGFGLSGMRRRIKELGGLVSIDGTAGGFTVRAELPLPTTSP
jgi:signal transduction histidine kinase